MSAAEEAEWFSEADQLRFFLLTNQQKSELIYTKFISYDKI